MRRLLLIFLLTLLPLQASWATVCAWCPDECAAELLAGAGAAQASGEAAEFDAAFDVDCDCTDCQLGSAGIAASAAASPLFPAPHSLASGNGSPFLESRQADRPERPNWRRAC